MAPEDPATADERIREALASLGLVWLDDHEGGVLEGVFRPRTETIPLERLRVLLRSWELFDRAYEPVPDVDLDALSSPGWIDAGNVQALATARRALPDDAATAERLARGLFVRADGTVAGLDVDACRRFLAWLNGREPG